MITNLRAYLPAAIAVGFLQQAGCHSASAQALPVSAATDSTRLTGAGTIVSPAKAAWQSPLDSYRERKVASLATYKSKVPSAVAPITVHCAAGLSKESSVALALDGSRYSIDSDNHVLLAAGTMLVATNSPLRIGCLAGQIYLSPRSIALIEADRDTLRVIDFSDQRKDGVKVVLGRLLVSLRPGVKVFVTPAKPSVAEIFDIPEVGQRSITVTEVPGLGFVTTSEVLLNDELGAEPLLAAVRSQGRAAVSPKMVKDITKMAAILNVVLRNREPYQKIKPEVLVAAASATPSRSSSNDAVQRNER